MQEVKGKENETQVERTVVVERKVSVTIKREIMGEKVAWQDLVSDQRIDNDNGNGNGRDRE